MSNTPSTHAGEFADARSPGTERYRDVCETKESVRSVAAVPDSIE